MEYILNGSLTLDEFLSKLGGKEPVPGGGGAAAVTAAIGLNLVCHNIFPPVPLN